MGRSGETSRGSTGSELFPMRYTDPGVQDAAGPRTGL